MRTTLTLDDDVVAALERRRADRGTRLRDEVNELLRAGLVASSQQEAEPAEYVLPTYDPGRALVTDYRELAGMLVDEDVDSALRARS